MQFIADSVDLLDAVRIVVGTEFGVCFCILVFQRRNGRVACVRGPALALDKCERRQVLIGTSPDCEDRPYSGAGGFYAIDN